MPKILTDPKQNMLCQVERLLAQGGYGAVTIRSVAQGCGVGVGTVYNYFPSKEALLAEYLLADWRLCVAAIGAQSGSARDTARCVYDQLLGYAEKHSAIFRDEAARGVFAGAFGPYHSLLRDQLAAPLRPFCQSDFGARFVAEALLTWTMAGTDFCEIWGMIAPLVT